MNLLTYDLKKVHISVINITLILLQNYILAVYVHAVYVYETLNPGSIVQIWAGNCNGRWKCLWNGKPNKVGHQPRQFGPPIEPPSFHVSQLRIHFEGSDLPYHAAIDAVCLLGKYLIQDLVPSNKILLHSVTK